MTAKRILESIVPPFLWKFGQRCRRRVLRSATDLAYAPTAWATPVTAAGDERQAWITFLAGQRNSCERLIARVQAGEPVVSLDADENLKHITFAYVLALVARSRQALTVLDYGGNLGDYYWLGKAFVPGLDVDYHCKELEEVAKAGREMTPAVTWHTDDACLDRRHDLVMFSSSLQCLPEWQSILRRAALAAPAYLFLSDVSSVRTVRSYVAVVKSQGMTQLQGQLNRQEIIETVERAGLHLVREFDMGPHPVVANAPEQPRCLGWLFRRDPV